MATATQDRRPLVAYLRVQRANDRAMIAILSRSTLKIEAELTRLSTRTGIGVAIQRAQLEAAQAAIHREIATLYRALGLQVLASRETAAAEALESLFPRALWRSVLPADDVDYLLRSMRATASQGIDAVENRLTLSQRTLSERVYHSRDLVDGKIDDLINSALARGASAADLARDVKGFIKPEVQGGIRYAALRLGRTELNNAFHAGQVLTGIKSPWITGLKWNLSGSHPRPDECNEYADQGVFRPEDVPGKPHPNCLCYTTAETVTRSEFISSFESGEYDSIIDQIQSAGGITIR